MQPILACWPTTVEEVQAVIRGAKFLGLKVRAAGATHTWTPLYSDKGQVVMYLGKLERSDGPRIELKQVNRILHVLFYWIQVSTQLLLGVVLVDYIQS